MNRKRYDKVCELFARIRPQSPEARGPDLDAACVGDPDLRCEVEALLAADADSMQLSSLAGLDVRPAADIEAQRVDETERQGGSIETETFPRQVGAYRITRRIASGGMGTVYEAAQERPRRVVAVKLMKQGIASRSALRRFEFESQLLARLRHPGIAHVYEAGTHDDGHGVVPYFAMEYIPNARAPARSGVRRRPGHVDFDQPDGCPASDDGEVGRGPNPSPRGTRGPSPRPG
ncbi:MAG: protein kinase [Phycisphaerae bacterium]